MNTSTNHMGKLGTEVAHLEERRSALGAEVERAADRLKELSARRDAFTPGASAGDRGAEGSFAALVAALEEEYASVLRTKALAEEAARELDRLILEAEVRQREEEKRLARRRYEALCKERYSLDGEAEEAMARLVEVLNRLDSLYSDQVRTAADAEDHSPTQQDLGAITEHWLARRLRRWLPNASFEKYDASLPELDPLALKPEPGGE